jgi:signal transduction histidine kinase
MRAKPTNHEQRSSLSGAAGGAVRSLNLRTKMALCFGALFAVILLVVSLVRTFGLPWTSDSGSYGLQQALVMKQLAFLADVEKERLRLWVEERKHDAKEFAERRAVVSSVTKLLPLIREYEGHPGSRNGLKAGLLSDKNGKALMAAVKGLRASHAGYGKIRIIGAGNGLIIASTDEKDLGRRISNPELATIAVEPGEGASVIVTQSPENGRTEVVISRSIQDGSLEGAEAASHALGEVILYVDAEKFLKPFLYGGSNLAESEDIILVDQNLRILVSPKFPLREGELVRPLEHVVKTEPASLAVQGKEGVLVSRDHRHVPILAAYRNIKVTPNSTWGLVVKVDRDEMLGPTRERLFHASLVSLLGVLAAAIMAALIAGRIARPIQDLRLVAREVEAGNLDARAPVNGSDEVGDLAATFNSMIEEIRHWQGDLEELVKIRTKRLTEVNEELKAEISERKRAQRERERLIVELESKNAELERFTYTVSHDLSSPLITIKTFVGFVEEAFREGSTEDVASDLERIRRAAEKMGQLLEDLLELSRIGRLVNPPSRLSMTQVAGEALELLAGAIAQRGADVEVDPDMPVVHGDRARLLEVLQNLTENALKFTRDQPHPKIEIGAAEVDGGPAFYVRDNGQGIDPAYQERIFRLFDKLDQTSEGTGIGLAIVKRIIEVHGGRIWVESQGSGHGSTFWFTLPGSHPTETGE